MPADARHLITVRPGPVLHVWRGATEVAVVPLGQQAALSLLADLARAIAEAQR